MGELAPRLAVGLVRQRVRSIAAYAAYLAASAILLSLVYPQPGWRWLAPVALAPAGLLAVRARHAWRLAWTGQVVWTLWWLWMLRWVIPVTVPGYLAMCVFLALYPTAALLLVRWLVRGCGVAAVLALPMGWVSMELLRGYWPAGGFGWFSLGHALGSWLPEQGAGRLVQTADLGGELVVSLLLAMPSGLMVDVVTRRRTRTARSRRGRVRPSIMIWALVWAGAWIYGEVRLRQDSSIQAESTSTWRVAAVQTNVPQDNKIAPDPQRLARDWQAMVALTEHAAQAQPNLVVWPETVVPGYLDDRSLQLSRTGAADWHLYHQQISAIAREGGFAMVVGAASVEDWTVRPDADHLTPIDRHNSAFVYHADGSRDPGRYDKMHLVPFGEYIPWVQTQPWLRDRFLRHLSPYAFDYTLDPGRTAIVFTIDGPTEGENWTLATPICIEDAVGRVCRAMVWREAGHVRAQDRKRVDLLVNLTNDAWYSGLSQRAQHLQIAAFRCIENRVPMVRAVNTGMSALIDSSGRVRAMVESSGPLVDGYDGASPRVRGQYTEGLVIGSVHRDVRVPLFARLGDGPVKAVAVGTGLLALAGWLRRGKVAARPTFGQDRRRSARER